MSLYPWRHLCICLAPLALSLVLFAAFIGTDDALVLHFKKVRAENPAMTSLIQSFSNIANFSLYAIYAGLFFIGLKKRDGMQIKRVLVFTAVQICIAAVLVQCIKIVVGSPRPFHALANPDNVPFSFNGLHHSFPSGHTTEVVNASGTLASWFQNSAFSCAMGVFIALMGSSRIYLSQHRLSDVVAGMALGSAATLLIHFFCSREYRYDYPFRQVSR